MCATRRRPRRLRFDWRTENWEKIRGNIAISFSQSFSMWDTRKFENSKLVCRWASSVRYSIPITCNGSTEFTFHHNIDRNAFYQIDWPENRLQAAYHWRSTFVVAKWSVHRECRPTEIPHVCACWMHLSPEVVAFTVRLAACPARWALSVNVTVIVPSVRVERSGYGAMPAM